MLALVLYVRGHIVPSFLVPHANAKYHARPRPHHPLWSCLFSETRNPTEGTQGGGGAALLRTSLARHRHICLDIAGGLFHKIDAAQSGPSGVK